MAFVLNSIITFGGIVQILLSFFMSLKTGRAICCGRTHVLKLFEHVMYLSKCSIYSYLKYEMISVTVRREIFGNGSD